MVVEGGVSFLTHRFRSTSTNRKDLKISICGLGFVGSSLAAAWLRYGATVFGFDKDPQVVEMVSKGGTHTGEPGVQEAYTLGLREKRFFVSSDLTKIYQDSKVKIIAVDVGLQNSKADLSTLISALRDMGGYISHGDTIIVKPTIPIGSSRQIIVPKLEEISGLKADRDFFYVYSPERISVGQALADIEEHYPAIVSGVGPKSLEKGVALYRLIAKKGVIIMSSIEAAEAEKIFEGVYRDVNIALANELAKLCTTFGLNFWEIREAANSQPYSQLHKAGIGVGGSCIPVYPFLLFETAARYGEKAPLTRLARKINLSMPSYCVRLTLDKANTAGIKQKKVALLGLAFRGDVSDKRLSPTYDVIRELSKYDLRVYVHDPYIREDRNLPKGVNLTNDLQKAVKGASMIIVCTDHKMYKQITEEYLIKISKTRPIVFDGRNILEPGLFKSLPFLVIGSNPNAKTN
jgi:nucleotide sugar dehydrogenase